MVNFELLICLPWWGGWVQWVSEWFKTNLSSQLNWHWTCQLELSLVKWWHISRQHVNIGVIMVELKNGIFQKFKVKSWMSKLICQERYAFLLSVCAPLCVYFPIREKVWNKIKVHHNFKKIDGGGAYKFNHIRNFISRFIIYWILKCRHLSKARYSGNVILWTIFVSEIKYQVDFQICIVNFSRNNG